MFVSIAIEGSNIVGGVVSKKLEDAIAYAQQDDRDFIVFPIFPAYIESDGEETELHDFVLKSVPPKHRRESRTIKAIRRMKKLGAVLRGETDGMEEEEIEDLYAYEEETLPERERERRKEERRKKRKEKRKEKRKAKRSKDDG